MSALPHDSWAERSLLGACLYYPPNIAICADAGLAPGHFYHPAHAYQYGRLWDAWQAGRDPDPGLTADGCNGPAYDAPQVSAPLEYVAPLLQLAARRAIILDALGEPRPFLSWEAWEQAKR